MLVKVGKYWQLVSFITMNVDNDLYVFHLKFTEITTKISNNNKADLLKNIEKNYLTGVGYLS